jgi:hypothetical protein
MGRKKYYDQNIYFWRIRNRFFDHVIYEISGSHNFRLFHLQFDFKISELRTQRNQIRRKAPFWYCGLLEYKTKIIFFIPG